MRSIGLVVALLVVLLSPVPAPAQEGCAAPSAAAQPAQTPPVGDGSLSLTRLSAFGGAVTAAARSSDALYIGQGGTLQITPSGSSAIITPLPDLVRDLALTPTAAYLAAGGSGLVVVADAAVRATLPLPGQAGAVAVQGARAYVAAAGVGGGLHIVDVTNPALPRLLGTAPVFGSADDVAIVGTTAYVAGGVNGGIEIFAVDDPTTPVRLGGLITPGAARALVIAGDRAYVAAGSCGLQTIDISDPAAPRLLGAVAVGGEALDLALAATQVYVAAGAGGVAAFDLQSGTPQPAAQTTVPGFVRRVSLNGNELLIAAEAGGLYALTPPTAGVAQRVLPGVAPLTVAASGGQAWLGLRQGGLQGVDLTDPAQPAAREGWAGAAAVRALALAPELERLYAGLDDAGLLTFAVAGAEPQELNRTRAPGQITALQYDTDAARLYAAVGAAGVAVYSLDDPDSPELLRTIDTPGAALGLAPFGELLLVADRTGLHIVDPVAATLRGTFAAPAGSFIQAVAVTGTTAFLADRSGVLVVDLNDPAAPRQVGAVTGFTAYRLVVDAERLYVAAGPAGVLAFAITQPERPQLLGSLATPGSALDLALIDEQIAVADEAGGLLLLEARELPYRLWLPFTLAL